MTTLYTTKGKSDGFGAQYQAMMSGIAFCEYKNYTYVHTPFHSLDHGLNLDEMNKFIGLKNEKEYSQDELKNIIHEDFSHDVHFGPNPSMYYTDKVLKKIRDAYYSTEKPQIPDIDIAIHIRRGDVGPDANNRYTGNDIYAKAIKALKKKHPDYKIKVFSQGKIEDFKDLGLDDSAFQLNAPVTNTFHSLVRAKIFVMAKSSFSYAAAILNENTIYYVEFHHKPLDKWINITTLISQEGGRKKRLTRRHKKRRYTRHKPKRRL